MSRPCGSGNCCPPRTLDPDYSKKVKSYKEFIASIKAGEKDLDAQETAATYNKARAVKAGKLDLAALYEGELKRIAEAKSERERLQKEEQIDRMDAHERAMLNSQLHKIDQTLRDIRNGN